MTKTLDSEIFPNSLKLFSKVLAFRQQVRHELLKYKYWYVLKHMETALNRAGL